MARRRRKDKFLQEMSSINRDRKERKEMRNSQRINGSLEPLSGITDELAFQTREFNALGKDMGRGLVRESAALGKGILREGTILAVDSLAAFLTVGTAPSKAPVRRGARRRRRR